MDSRLFRRAVSASLIAVALVLAYVELAGAQTPASSRVTITSSPAPESLRPPRKSATRPGVMAKMAFDVRILFDRTRLPEPLPAAPGGAVILARELQLENVHYPVGTSQLVIVADRLRVGPNGIIDSSGRQPRASAGKIVLVARQLTCESGGSLQLIAKGGSQAGAGGTVLVIAGTVESEAAGESGVRDPRRGLDRRRDRRPWLPSKPAHPRAGGPAATEGTLPPCIVASADGGPGATFEVRDHRAGRPETGTRTLPPGPAGRVIGSELRPAVLQDPFVQTAWSMWAVEWLETLQLEIYDASRTSNYPRVLKLLRDYEAFDAPIDLVSPDMRDRYRAVLDDLNSYRLTALPALMVEDVTVRPGGLPRNVTLFTEGTSFRASLAPTHALATKANIGGRSVIGMLEYRNERPDELAIEGEWELTVDPWSERLAAEQLAKAGGTLDGVFAGWSFDAKPIQELGVRSATATLLPSGRRLRLRLLVDADRANLVFWRLLNSAGIPWTVDWTFRESKTGRVVTGTWAGPTLSFIHQREPAVNVVEGALTNAGSSAVTVNYVRGKDGSFVALEPALRIKPGESVPLPATAAVPGPVSVPPEAVETAFDPERFGSDFYVVNGDQVVDRVTVRNNLPAADSLRGVFDRLEIKVTASVDGDTTLAPVAAGPFVLSASGTRGGEISIPFLRLSRGTRRLTVEGTAYYVDGSVRTLKPTTFDTLAISITREMFVE